MCMGQDIFPEIFKLEIIEDCDQGGSSRSADGYVCATSKYLEDPGFTGEFHSKSV